MKSKNLIKIILPLVLLFHYGDAFGHTNHLRTMFSNNEAVIYELNIRTFGAKDNDGDEIINVYNGDEKGTFLNAISRLDELKSLGFNTLYVMPITKTGKLKALGTAGSLYAMDSFNTINPQFDDISNDMSITEEAKEFVSRAHDLGLNVIIDMPCAGSYDFSLKDKDLFMRDKNGQSVIPSDWTDVRLFKIYNEDRTLNQDVLNGYKSFVDMVKEIGADGIRADVAGIKPKEFWSELINYARRDDKEFLFLAEANPSWKNPAKAQNFYTSVENLLKAGFDSYYGEYNEFSQITRVKDFNKVIKREQNILKNFDKKSTIGSFVTHDVQSPTINGDKGRSELYTWLNVTLPVNTFFLDGYLTGDDFLYSYKDKKAQITETDDDYYFAHKGKMDIFNFSRAPKGKYQDIYDDVKKAINFKIWAHDILKDASYRPLDTSNPSVIGYKRKNKNDTIVVIGNLDEKNSHKVKIKIPNTKNHTVIPIKTGNEPDINKKNMVIDLGPNEVRVYLFSKKNK